MPLRPMRACSTPGHTHLLAYSERCPDKPAWGGRSQVQRTGQPRLDQATRLRVLARDAYTCQTPGCAAGNARQVDHEIPRAEGGTDEEHNLVTRCDACHASKSGTEGARAARRRRIG